jgi:parallel beta-helix repeat protein
MTRRTHRRRSWCSLMHDGVAIGLITLSALVAPTLAHAAEFVVDDNGSECPRKPTTHTTIQAAVDTAIQVGGQHDIFICSGVYNENVLIDAGQTALRLTGQSVTTTFIKGTGNNNPGPIVEVIGSESISIKALTVDGSSQLVPQEDRGVVYGLRAIDSNVTLYDIAAINIRNPDGSARGIAVAAESSQPQDSQHGVASRMAITDSFVSEFTHVGILGEGTGVTLDVLNNFVTGPNYSPVWAPNGIQISSGAKGRVKENFVMGIEASRPQKGMGSGILASCAKEGTRLVDNTVENAHEGLVVADSSGIVVASNTVIRSNLAYSLQVLGKVYGETGCPDGMIPPVKDNRLRRNKAFESTEVGIGLVSFDLTQGVPQDNVIRRNEINDSQIDGIHIFDGEDNAVRRNEIEGSQAGFDAVDNTKGSKTAGTANRWSDNDCDTSLLNGLCQ